METEKPTPKNLIPSSFSQAFLAGAATGTGSLAGSLLFDIPADQAFKMATGVFLAGASYSFWSSFRDSRLLTAPKKRKRRQIPFNHGKGQSNINMELSTVQGGHILRESYFDGLKRFVSGSSKSSQRIIKPVIRPNELDEFVFCSQDLQLREIHVKLFLQSAWRNREYGKGLSMRRWVRNFSQRPSWYKELTPMWYYAVMDMIFKAESYTQWQLVIKYSNGWTSLANGDLRLAMNVLKWYECDGRRK